VTELDPVIRRVLVALSGRADELALLEAGAELAARMQAELAALFVEDLGLLRASRLPGVFELGRLSAQSRRLDPVELERALRTAASQAEACLRQAAAARAIRFSFQIAQGHLQQQVLTLAGRMDAILMGAPGAAGRQRQPARPVAVLYDGSPEAGQALTLAAALAEALGVPCTALIPARDTAEYSTRLAHARLRAGGLGGLGGERTASAEAGALADAANRLRASTLVLPALRSAGEGDWLKALLKRLDCDLLLLR